MTVTTNASTNARPVQQTLTKPTVATDAQALATAALAAELAALRAENAALKAGKPKAAAITAKVSDGGALSIYGLGRFPVTLYVEGFDRLNAAWSEMVRFVEAHRAEFKGKDETFEGYCKRVGKDAAAITAKRAEAAAKRNG